jgi:hypothetical protein
VIFTFAPNNPNAGDTVRFDASLSTDPDGRITQYAWDFGDGNTGTGVTTTHAYARDGVFTVTLTVTDDHGATGQAVKTIPVGVPTTSPPTPAPPPPTPGGKPAIIEIIHYKTADATNLNGQWAILRANQTVSMGGWTLADELGDRGVASHVYHFAKGFTLQAGQHIQIFSGCGTDSSSALYWCARTLIWGLGEDTAVLRDDKGQEIDDCHYADPGSDEPGITEYNCETHEYK